METRIAPLVALCATGGSGRSTAHAGDRVPRSCRFDGAVTFKPAVGILPTEISAVAKATSTCDGQPATWKATDAGSASCALPSGPGTGWLTVGDQTTKHPTQTAILAGIGTITLPGTPLLAYAHLQRPGGLGVFTSCLTTGASSAPIHIQMLNTCLN